MNTINVGQESPMGFGERDSEEPFIPMNEFLKLARGFEPGLGTSEILERDMNLCMGGTALRGIDPEEEEL